MPRHKVKKAWALTDHKFEAEQRRVRRLGRICFSVYTVVGILEVIGLIVSALHRENPRARGAVFIGMGALLLLAAAFMIFSNLRGWTKLEIYPYDYNMSERGHIYEVDIRSSTDEQTRKDDLYEHIFFTVFCLAILIGGAIYLFLLAKTVLS
ncbi:MAG: hypothetical protein E7617_08090 [Ruminococcaceae bacterium]|nr:hypothetical protein [Oscillospiraceae bacterium]